MPDYFASRGADLSITKVQAIAAIDNLIRPEAFVIAFNDCFYLIGWVLVLGGLTVLLCKRLYFANVLNWLDKLVGIN